MSNSYKNISVKEKGRIVNVLRHYTLNPEIIKPTITKNTLAFVNKIYLIDKGAKKYILRESRPTTDYNHIKLEVETLNFLQKKHFRLTPAFIKNNNNRHIARIKNLYYTVQTFMPGQTKANWDNLSSFSVKKLKNFFAASALFSRAIQGFTGKTRIKNIGLADYVNNGLCDFERKIKIMPDSPGRILVEKDARSISAFINQAKKEFAKADYRHLPQQLVHFDWHPGNVNFINDKVSGIFDFDWLRFDSRITDMAGTIAQSCYYYGGAKGGLYRKTRIQAGLRAYRKAYGPSEFKKKEENHLIKIALKGCIIFQLLFIMGEYTAHIGSKRHLAALDHFVKLILRNDYDYLLAD